MLTIIFLVGEQSQNRTLMAGGRSRDFTEGRQEIDLAQNTKINGFVFETPFFSEGLSKELDSDLFVLLGVNLGAKTLKCDLGRRAAFDLAV